MSSLGSFGAARREADPAAERDTFEFFGEHYEVVGSIPAILMLQLGAASTGKVSQTEMFAGLWEALRMSLDEPDLPADAPEGTPEPKRQFAQLYRAAVANDCEFEDLGRLVMALFEAQQGRPTAAVSDSGRGPQSSSTSSSGSSSALQVLPGMRPVSDLLTGTG